MQRTTLSPRRLLPLFWGSVYPLTSGSFHCQFSTTARRLAEKEESEAKRDSRRRSIEALQKWHQENPKSRSESMLLWHKNNPGVRAEALRKWHRENPNVASERTRLWHKNNPGVRVETLRKWHRENPGARAEILRTWHKNNPGVTSKKLRKWHQEHPEARSKNVLKFIERNPGCMEGRLLRWAQENPDLVLESRKRIVKTQRDKLLRRMTGKAPSYIIASASGSFTVQVGTTPIVIHNKIASLWGLHHVPQEERFAMITMDVAKEPHDHPWAQKSIETDDASRLGIQVRFSTYKPEWIATENPNRVALANSIVDFLTGKIVDFDTHTWTTDRLPFLGVWARSLVSRSSWTESFDNPEERRAALLDGKPEVHTWKPTGRYHKMMIDHRGSGEPEYVPATTIDPLGTPPNSSNYVRRRIGNTDSDVSG